MVIETNEIKWVDSEGNSWRIRETEFGLEIRTCGTWHVLTTDLSGKLNVQ